MSQMISKVDMYNTIHKFYDENIDNIINGEMTLNEFITYIVKDTKAFESDCDIMIFLIEKIFEECKSFDGQFPIKYYATNEEFYEDDCEATEDDLEHLTDRYIETFYKN